MQEGNPPDSDRSSGLRDRTAEGSARRLILWRAVAGMAAAVALGTTMVALELAQSMGVRATRSQHRAAQLYAKARTLKHNLALADKQLTSAEREVKLFDHLGEILMAPDVKLFRIGSGDSAHSARALLIASEKVGEAVFAADGLSAPAPRQVYALWCGPSRGTAIKENEFTVTDGRAMTLADWKRGCDLWQCFVTREAAAGAERPGGEIVLAGQLFASVARVPLEAEPKRGGRYMMRER